jgi:DNA polymerase-1
MGPITVYHDANTAMECLLKWFKAGVESNERTFISVDTETTSLDFRKAELVCMAFSNGVDTVVMDDKVCNDREFKIFLDHWLDHQRIHWVYQNASYDVKVFRHLGIRAHASDDTMLMHYTMDERPGTHSLEDLERRYLGVDKYEREFEDAWARCREKYGKDAHYGLIEPIQILWKYNARDAYYTHVLAELFYKLMKDRERKLYWEVLMPLTRRKMVLEEGGILFDDVLCRELEAEVEVEVEALKASLAQMVGIPGLNPNSPKQMGEVLFTRYRLPKFRGKVTTNKDALAVIQKRLPAGHAAHPVLNALAEYRKRTKLLSTYLTGFYKWIDDDGRVRTEYLVHGTPTGRFASRNPNLQNIPRDSKIRNMFIARKGYTLIEADYSQAELRVLAVLSGDLPYR